MMILHAPFLILYLRCVVPSVFLMGSSVTFWLALTVAKVISLPLGGREAFRRIDQRLLSSYMGMFGYFFENWSGVQYCFYGDALPQVPENVLYISNHQSAVDWIVADLLCLKQGGVGGRVRYLLKNTIMYVPLYGFYLATRNNIYLKRNSKDGTRQLTEKLEKLKDFPVWLVIFPEGTRFNVNKPNKLKQSQEFAAKYGLPKLNQVLTPRTTGFEISMDVLRDHLQAVYDVTIIYEGREGFATRTPATGMFGFYSGDCQKVHIHIKRFDITQVPLETEEQKRWIFERFQAKDKLITNFMSTGIITDTKQSLPLLPFYSIPPTLVYGAALLLMATTKRGRALWVWSVLLYSIVGYTAIASKLVS